MTLFSQNLASLHAVTTAMENTGIRRLMVISGQSDWSSEQCALLRARLHGDWLWVGDNPETEKGCRPGALNNLLGREFHHAVFDAREGFNSEAFAALAGTLSAGSWLVLLLPPLDTWPDRIDADSARWVDQKTAISTPRFAYRFLHILQRHYPATWVWQENHPLHLPVASSLPPWQVADGAPLAEQAALLEQIITMPQGVVVVTAARGRGKSALAGMLIQRWQGSVIVSAPSRVTADVIANHAKQPLVFMAPDALLAAKRQQAGPLADWLIVDEAAAIPGPLLYQMIAGFSRVLLITTVQGYEGTGRGFLLKLCAALPGVRMHSLTHPVRWARGCPLEQFISDLFLFDEQPIPALSTVISADSVTVGQAVPDQDAEIYRLLTSAHYKTSPLDLRRMLDAPGQHVFQAQWQSVLCGALWVVEEGGLPASLSQAVWAGRRRPGGNLVAQSLAAHGGAPLAATLYGWRISRIAVLAAFQHQGIGQQLVARMAVTAPDHCDYLSVSFGFTEDLWRFWSRAGFSLVRIGTVLEASSGCYTAMALLPLTAQGHALVAHETRRLARDVSWLRPWVTIDIPVIAEEEHALDEDDWLELAGFAFAHRPLMTCCGSLNRLLKVCPLPLEALRGELVARQSPGELSRQLGLTGRKALLVRQRVEACSALNWCDAIKATCLEQYVAQMI